MRSNVHENNRNSDMEDQDVFCRVIQREVNTITSVETIYKIRGGAHIRTKSVLSGERAYTDALYFAAVAAFKMRY